MYFGSLHAWTRRLGSLPDLGPGRLLVESVPLAAVVAFWSVIGAAAGGGAAGDAVRYAGALMTGAYALVRGWQFASDNSARELPLTARSLVRANVAPAIVCVGWVAAAAVLESLLFGLWVTLEPILSLERFQGVALQFVEASEFVGAATAFLAVVLYAAAFVRTYAGPASPRGAAAGATGAASGDD
jgi:hypothetical protein